MMNLIRMNFYRMLHTKSTWIIAVCMVALMGTVAVTNCVSMKNHEQGGMSVQLKTDTDDNGNEVISDTAQNTDAPDITIFDSFANGMASGDVLLFLVIFTVVFVYAEEKNGYIKNIAHATKNRWDTFLSKFPVLVVYILAGMLVCFIVMSVIYKIYYPDMAFHFTTDNVIYFLIVLLGHLAFIIVTAAIITVTRNSALSMTSTILLSLGFGSLLISLTNYIVNYKIDFGKYVIISSMNKLEVGASTGDIARTIAVFVIWGAIGLAAGMSITKHRDIV